MTLAVTTYTAAVMGLLLLALSYRISQIRIANKVNIGDGGDPELFARIRAQANLAEYVPAILILMGLIEYATGYSILLGVCALVTILSRIAHAIGMGRPSPNPFRVAGTAGTWIVLLVLSVWALIVAIQL
jgi:uncharacterized membrane protein YecN with MAPEG domain